MNYLCSKAHRFLRKLLMNNVIRVPGRNCAGRRMRTLGTSASQLWVRGR